MSKAITGGQARSLIASFAVDTPWDEITTDIQFFIELPPTERGERFATFVRNGCRPMTGIKLHIDRSKPFNPTEFIGAGWSIWRGPANGNGLEGEEEQNKFSLARTEVNMNKIVLATTLKEGEVSITGEERIKRLDARNATRMDAAIFQTLWNNKHLIPERFKEKTNDNTTYVFVDGTTLRGPDGDRYSLYFYWYADDREWNWDYYWLGSGRNAYDPSALLAS